MSPLHNHANHKTTYKIARSSKMPYTGDSVGLNANAAEFVPLALQQSQESRQHSLHHAQPEQDLSERSLGYTDRVPAFAATRRPARGHMLPSTSGECLCFRSCV